ncbi:glycosyltransferase family protein [soil metagenome]
MGVLIPQTGGWSSNSLFHTLQFMDRVLIYSHDTFGLGHLRRCLKIATALVASASASHVIIATGSARARSFPLPDGIDIVALPAAIKSSDGTYNSLTLGLDLDDLSMIRRGLVLSVIRTFKPDLFLVDHAPIGMAGELIPVLEEIAHLDRRPRIVLGMRDIVDDSSKVDADWTSKGDWHELNNHYDGVIVYGDPVVKTSAIELGMAARLEIPVEHIGYVAPPPVELRPRRGRRPTVLVTVGGGGDGLPILETYVEFLLNSPLARAIRSVLVTGPFAPASPLGRTIDQMAGLPVEIVSFSDRMEALLATADGAVAMAGYNTVAELLSYHVPALLVPRVKPRVEQWLRATRLAALAPLHPVAAEDLTVGHVEDFVARLLHTTEHAGYQLDLDGARAASQALVRVASRSLAGAPA